MTALKTTSHSDPELAQLKSLIRDVPDFPKKGIIFKDITPILKDQKAFKISVDRILTALSKTKIDYVIGIESRGFIFSPAVAYQMNAGFIPVRKSGKLPYKTIQVPYTLEYGEAILEMHEDAIEPGARVAIVDDLLATGGTSLAAAQLVEKLGGKVELLAFIVELSFLKGRNQLLPRKVVSLVQY